MIKRLMEKLLYLTWRGPSRQESRQSVEEQDERIESRRRARVKVDATVTVEGKPSENLFREAFNLKKGNDEAT